jgi:hypothetical protein
MSGLSSISQMLPSGGPPLCSRPKLSRSQLLVSNDTAIGLELYSISMTTSTADYLATMVSLTSIGQRVHKLKRRDCGQVTISFEFL